LRGACDQGASIVASLGQSGKAQKDEYLRRDSL
jgi:hypothetical protein